MVYCDIPTQVVDFESHVNQFSLLCDMHVMNVHFVCDKLCNYAALHTLY